MEIEFSVRPFQLRLKSSERRAGRRSVYINAQSVDVALYRAATRRVVSQLLLENAQLKRGARPVVVVGRSGLLGRLARRVLAEPPK